MAMTCERGHADHEAASAQERGRLVGGRYPSLGRIRPIQLLLLAWAVCYAGDLAAFTAGSVYAYRAGGAGLVGVLGLARGVPAGLLVPLITSWSDRVRRERLLIASVVPRALLLAAAAMTDGGQAVLVVVLVALEGGLASVFRQVQAALLPWLASTPDQLAGANTAVSVLQSVATVGGPALAAGLLAVGTPQSAVLAACGLIAVGAVLLTGVRPRSSPALVPAAGHLRQFRVDLATGWEAGVWRPGPRALFLPAAAQTFARGVLTVLTVVIAVDLFSLGSAAIGWLSAVLGVGGLLAGPLAVALVRGRRVARCFGAGVAGWGLPMVLLAFTHAPYWPYLMFAVIGVANVFDDAGVYSALPQVIPPSLTGRALGTRRGALLISMGLGSAAAPLLIHACGARGTLIAAGMLLIAAAASSTPRTATVTASTRLHVKILAREEFLAAVTGNPDSAQSADEVISARLRNSWPRRTAIGRAGPGATNHDTERDPSPGHARYGPARNRMD
jgi:MFS family permease